MVFQIGQLYESACRLWNPIGRCGKHCRR